MFLFFNVYIKKKRCTKDSKVVIVGIGGLGHLALQFARAMDMKDILAVTTSKNKEKEILSLGATKVLLGSDPFKPHYGNYDFVLITVSAELKYIEYIKLLKNDSRLCFVGLPPSGLFVC